jgi:hypothetical protein
LVVERRSDDRQGLERQGTEHHRKMISCACLHGTPRCGRLARGHGYYRSPNSFGGRYRHLGVWALGKILQASTSRRVAREAAGAVPSRMTPTTSPTAQRI